MKKRQFRFETITPPPSREIGHEALNRAPAIPLDAAVPAATTARAETILHRQSPPMALLDEVIFLLHTAAEIEHCLMIQYLYAAYSLSADSSPHAEWRDVLLQIAREEMGHLMAMQNILLSLGGPLNFEREDFPYNEFYPFPFTMEPLSVRSLAKYVLAEMPRLEDIPPQLGFDVVQVRADAGAAEDEIDRVRALFSLLSTLSNALSADAVRVDSLPIQADPDDWQAGSWNLILKQVGSLTGKMDGLVPLIDAVGAQGEGPTVTPEGEKSHFLRFFELYNKVKEHAAAHGEASLSRAVPIDPTVFDSTADGYLQHPIANAWGDIHNHRFRWLLLCLQHHLVSAAGAPERDRLAVWAFEEMQNLSQISDLLTELPQHDPVQPDPYGRPRVAGPTFELPYSLSIPHRPIDRWRYHELLAVHSLDQLGRAPGFPRLVRDLEESDGERLTFVRQMQESNP